MNETLKKLSGLWAFTKKGKRRFIPAVVMMIVGSFIFASIPMVARDYLDMVAESVGYEFSFDATEIQEAMLILALMIGAWYLFDSIGKAVIIDDSSSTLLRDALAKKSERISVAHLEDRPLGDLTALIANDVPVVMRMMTVYIPGFFVQLALIIFIMAMMFWLNIALASVYLILLMASFTITRRIGENMNRHLRRRQRSLGELNGFFGDVITNHSMVKIYGLEDKAYRRFKSIDDSHRRSYVRTATAFGYVEPISRVIDNLGYFLTAVMGAFMIVNGGISFATFIAFISYATIIGRPLVAFSDSINKIQDGIASYDRILDFLNTVEMPDESAFLDLDIGSVRGEIEFRNVVFGYPGGDPVLRNVNLRIEAGKTTVIVGRDGSGKSTLIDLIMGFRNVSGGEVLLDGVNVADVKNSELRKVIGVASQDPWIFEGTVSENLSITETRERIIEVSKMTGFHRFVMRFPKGYDTVIGGRGHGLSSGEMQLLSMTRLMLYGSKVLVFDESSSEIDPLTSLNAFNGVRELFTDRTVIIVDNTPISVMNADRVIFMGDGTIDDAGSHSELMYRNSRYAEMIRNMIS